MLTCWCCSKYPHHRHFLHVALPEFRIADVQVFNGTCQVVVCGDDSYSKHDCRVRQISQKTLAARSPQDAGTTVASRYQPKTAAVTAVTQRQRGGKAQLCPMEEGKKEERDKTRTEIPVGYNASRGAVAVNVQLQPRRAKLDGGGLLTGAPQLSASCF